MTSTAHISSPKSAEGFGYPLGFVGAVAATVISVAAGAAGHHVYAAVALTLVVAGVAATTSLRAALGTAVVAWGLQAGFVIGRIGRLVFDAESARDAVVFTAAGLLVGGVAAALHTARAHTAPLVTTGVTTAVNEPPTAESDPAHVTHVEMDSLSGSATDRLVPDTRRNLGGSYV
jgi:hypothetical protein